MFNPTSGQQLMKITSPDPGEISFGSSIAQFGGSIIIADHQADYGSNVREGTVYMFDGATGQHVRTFHRPSPATFGYFGFDIEVASSRLFASDESPSSNYRGKVHVLNPSTGQLLSTINNPEPVGDSHGFGLDLEEHNGDIFISSRANLYRGAVYRYDGSTLAQELKIPNPFPQDYADFGSAIHRDASRLLVGAPGTNRANRTAVGEAYLFNADTGALLRTFTNPEPDDYANFGGSVTLLGDFAVVGAPGTDFTPPNSGPRNTGAMYIFNATTGSLLSKIVNPEAGQNDYFTIGGLLSIDNLLIAPNQFNDVNGVSSAGTVYVYSTLPVPEPSTLSLAVIGVIAVGSAAYRRHKSKR